MKSLLVLLLVGCAYTIVSAVELSPPECWTFDNGDSGWVNVGPYNWKFTALGFYPDDTNIPSFQPYTESLQYTWLQDQETPPQSGAIQSPSVTLNDGDILTATIYRHLIESTANDSARPLLRFYNGYAYVDLIYSVNYDEFNILTSLPCGSSAPSSTICCHDAIYPCSGYLEIDGQVLIRDELLVIDAVGLNDYCNGTTPPTPAPTTTTTRPTTTTPHEECECSFDESGLCDWSAAYITNGWVWSYNFPTSIIPAPPSRSYYVYINDTSADFYYPYSLSDGLTGVTPNTIFQFELYLFTSTSSNDLEIVFKESSGVEHLLMSWNTGFSWSSWSIPCAGCCSSANPCSGTIRVRTNVLVSTQLQAAVDNFIVYNAGCNGPPPSDHCECDFDNSGECQWSADFITDGWIWSYDFPPNCDGIPGRNGYYYYVVDTSAQLYYPYSMSPYGLYDISAETTFSFVYFMSATYDGRNEFKFSFENQDGTKVQLYQDYSGTAGVWKSVSVSCNNCCGARATCYGQVWFETVNTPHTHLVVAVDSFYVDDASCEA